MSDFGTASIDGSHASVRFERRYGAPVEGVWAALTQQASLGPVARRGGDDLSRGRRVPAPALARRRADDQFGSAL